MILKDYQEATKRTLPDLEDTKLNIAHMIYGMNSEFVELYSAIDDINRGEELTDIMWYISNYCNFKNIDSWRIFLFGKNYYRILTNDDYIEQLQCKISVLTDLEKKCLAYNKHIEKIVFVEAVCDMLEALNDCYVYYNIDAEVSMGKNIEKLKVRYPEKFSTENANNRDLEAEHEKLK